MTPQSPRIIAVTPNPAIDVTIEVDRLVDEATHRIGAAQRRLGGKGVNVATVAAAQGYPAAVLGPVSESSLAVLRERGLDLPQEVTLALSPTSVALRETWAIHRTGDNATVIINESGQEHPDHVWQHMRETINSLTQQGAQVLTISGSWPPGTDATTLTELIDAGCAAGISHIIVDCAGNNLVAAARRGAIVKPNAAEITETTGCTDPLEGARQLVGEGSPLVIASLGPEGLLAVTADEAISAKLPAPLRGNPTGAGDSLVAAMACSLLDDLSLQDLIIRGVAWSAAAVLVPYAGAIDPSWPDIVGDVITSSV